MFHGGTNPKGLYQESKRTGYPNDYPVMDYDFQAPIDRYGYPRESFLRLKNLNYFLNTFGESFAAMQPFCNPLPEKADDFSSPRCSVRINEKGEGYFFISSYERNHPTKDFEALNVELDTPQSCCRRSMSKQVPCFFILSISLPEEFFLIIFWLVRLRKLHMTA
jgi:hypothetical protein